MCRMEQNGAEWNGPKVMELLKHKPWNEIAFKLVKCILYWDDVLMQPVKINTIMTDFQ